MIVKIIRFLCFYLTGFGFRALSACWIKFDTGISIGAWVATFLNDSTSLVLAWVFKFLYHIIGKIINASPVNSMRVLTTKLQFKLYIKNKTNIYIWYLFHFLFTHNKNGKNRLLNGIKYDAFHFSSTKYRTIATIKTITKCCDKTMDQTLTITCVCACCLFFH